MMWAVKNSTDWLACLYVASKPDHPLEYLFVCFNYQEVYYPRNTLKRLISSSRDFT